MTVEVTEMAYDKPGLYRAGQFVGQHGIFASLNFGVPEYDTAVGMIIEEGGGRWMTDDEYAAIRAGSTGDKE